MDLWVFIVIQERGVLDCLLGRNLSLKKTIPSNLRGVTVPLVNAIEQYMVKVVEAIANPFFGFSPEEAGKKLDIPLILPENDESAHFGMVDIACYHNKQEREEETPEMNCVAHYDPGLLSLSVIQTSEGLQLQDGNGVWVNGPPQNSNIGVIWAGDAAKRLNESFKAGIHRVIFPKIHGFPRLSIWGEVCTRSQVLVKEDTYAPPIKKKHIEKKKSNDEPRLTLRNPYIEEKMKNLKKDEFNTPTKLLIPNISGEYIVPVPSGKLLEALKLVEEVHGIPFTKIMTRYPIYNDEGEVIGMNGELYFE
jgi:hypothetical protein